MSDVLKGKKILLVTNTNMASNPRCFKEVKALLANGAQVTVAKSVFNNWSNDYEQQIESSLPSVTWIKVDATRKSLATWLRATVVQKEAKLLSKRIKSTRIIAYALDKRSYLLEKALGKVTDRFDAVIAHNPGAFWPAYNYAVKNNVPLGIDIEDYHPGEYNDEQYKSSMLALMNGVLPHASYISAAAPLILKHTLDNVAAKNVKATVINNVFSLGQQPVFKELPVGDALTLFWFSQHVGMDRGLQDIIGAMNLISDFTIALTLMGNCDDATKAALNNLLTSNKHTLVFKAPAPEAELIQEASNHHIGLALENGANLNRNICLTNKIFTYLLSGNCIIASDTDAQKGFLGTYPQVGVIYKSGDVQALADIVSSLYNNKESLLEKRNAAYQLAATKLNWETEQQHFIKLITEL